MFIEAVLTREEIQALLSEALPMTLGLGDPGAGHSLALSDLQEVRLVPDSGVQVTCGARVHWPVLGIDVPIVLHSLRLLMTPAMRADPGGDALTFRIAVEHVGVTGLPGAIDDKLRGAINRKLAEPHAELSWDFGSLFRHVLALPPALEPPSAVLMRAAWGKLKITDDALVAAVSVHMIHLRHGSPVPAEFAMVVGAGWLRPAPPMP